MTRSLLSYSTAESLGYTVVACDDGYIDKVGEGSRTIVACISWKGSKPGAPVDAKLSVIKVDSAGTTSIISWLSSSLAAPRKPLLLLDSITIAGFDVVSPTAFKKLTGGDLIAVYSREPRRKKLLEALEFSNAELKRAKERVLLWMLDTLKPIDTVRGRLYIASTLDHETAVRIVEELQGHARKPEPLRVAHYTASRTSLELKSQSCI